MEIDEDYFEADVQEADLVEETPAAVSRFWRAVVRILTRGIVSHLYQRLASQTLPRLQCLLDLEMTFRFRHPSRSARLSPTLSL